MPLFYATFPVAPDFQDKMTLGESSRRASIAVAWGAPMEARWPAESRRTAAATITLRGPTEIRNFREFLMQIRGKWRPFQWPSWTRDFRATGTSAVGDTTLVVQRNFEEFLADDTPDAAGRNIWCYTPGRTLWIGRVQDAVDDGGNSTITVQPPLPFAEDLTRCIWGFCWFARFAEDEITWDHITPDRARVQIGIVEARNQQDREIDQTIEGVDIYESNALTRVQEFATRPELDDLLTFETIGPDAWATPQEFAFSADWVGTLSLAGFEWVGPATSHASALWDGDPEEVEHVTGAFDVLGREALAWQEDADTIRARWYNAGVPQSLEFTGRSPMLFQNWVINGDISGGEADLMIYYIKDGESKIYARAQRDAFATEYIATTTPVMPLWLTTIGINPDGDRVRIEGMTVCHNLGRWESGLYNPPIPPPTERMAGSIEAAWTYEFPTIEGASGDAGSGGEITLEAEYLFEAPTVVDIAISDDAAGEPPTPEAEYLYVMVDGDSGEEVTSASITTEGTTGQVAQDATTDDETTTQITITGAYEN